jgi:hypothetical protein
MGRQVKEIKITINFDHNWQAFPWVKQHCPSFINNDVHLVDEQAKLYDMRYIDYFFREEKDAAFFALKWVRN